MKTSVTMTMTAKEENPKEENLIHFFQDLLTMETPCLGPL